MNNRENGYVYFITEHPSGLVKIGFSCDPELRLEALKTRQSRQLKLLAHYPGTRRDERDEHARWAEYRARGEWFKPSTQLFAHISAIRAGSLTRETCAEKKDPWTSSAQKWLAYLTEREIARGNSRSPREARAALGRRHHVPVSKLYSLNRSRSAEIQSEIYYALRDAFFEEKRSELRDLQIEVGKMVSEKETERRQSALLSNTKLINRVLGISDEPPTLADIEAVKTALGIAPDEESAS